MRIPTSSYSRRLLAAYILGASGWLLGGGGLLLWLTRDLLLLAGGLFVLLGVFIAVTALLLQHLLQALHQPEPPGPQPQTLFTASHAAMLLIDPASGVIVDANPAAARFYGYPRDVLRTMAISDLNTLPPDAIREEMAQAQAQARSFFRFRHRLASGALRDVEVYSWPVQLGGRLLLHSIVHDVTERASAETHLAAVIDSVMDAIVSVDEEQRIVLFNPAAAQLFGYAASDMLGQPLGRLLPPEARAAHRWYFTRRIERSYAVKRAAVRTFA